MRVLRTHIAAARESGLPLVIHSVRQDGPWRPCCATNTARARLRP